MEKVPIIGTSYLQNLAYLGHKKTIGNELPIANWLVMPNDYSPTYGTQII